MKTWQITKLYGRLLLRLGKDIVTRDFFRFSSRAQQLKPFAHSIRLTQEIKLSATFGNKIFNLSAANAKINQYIIQPNEIFSFWQAIGNPTKQFRKSRTIRNGQITEEAGGGLCQAAGIIYLASLLAGLEVMERHNHSIDLYTEETRFSPLGSDATVVYGYKDLRIRNKYPFPIKFELHIKDTTLILLLASAEAITKNRIQFKIQHSATSKFVGTLNSNNEIIEVSTYRLPVETIDLILP